MIPSVAPLAERYDATSEMVVTARARVRCIPWSAPNAARMRRFRSSPVATARFTVAIASANSGQPHGQTGNRALETGGGGNRPLPSVQILAANYRRSTREGKTLRIYVGNFAYEMREQELREAFEAYGQVQEVSIVQDRDTGRSKGFAFVEMPTSAEAQAAIDALGGKELAGRTITVNEARPRQERSIGGGGGYGNRGSGGFVSRNSAWSGGRSGRGSGGRGGGGGNQNSRRHSDRSPRW